MADEKNNTNRNSDSDNASLEIPVDGSLGLLANGDLGLIAWRIARKKAKAKQQPTDTFPSYDDVPAVE